MNFKTERLTYIVFGILIFIHIWVEFPYDIEILSILAGIVSMSTLVNGIRFRIRRTHLIELGEREHFHNQFLGAVYFILIIGAYVFLMKKLDEWNVLPERESPVVSSFSVIVFLPQLIRFLLGVAFKEVKDYLYITDQGILASMHTTESFIWNDFQSYRILHDQKLLRFRKKKPSKKSKFLFVSYHDEYFKEHQAHILSILDKNLKSEH